MSQYDPDEITVLMCLPVEGDHRYIVPGSIQRQCQDCGAPVWVAPSGQQLLIESSAIVVCMNCGRARAKEQLGDLEITSKQIDEIKEWRKRN